ALTQAQRLCDHIASHHFTLNYQLTCSFGVGMWSPGQSPQHFLRRVDAALYRAKARGRNRVERS
ncbi:MAG: diguanylate cyclase domain-containing protein, partial [Sulfobacillus sp.]